MLTPDDLARREVHYCVSYLVSTLAKDAFSLPPGLDLGELASQAADLAAPIDDWEEAAIQEGWIVDAGLFASHSLETTAKASPLDACGWQDLCEEYDIEPYQREIYEHWIVSEWLADKLAEKGEKVDKDFAGMVVWARTTTGQGIASDSVIEAICADLNAA